LRFALQRSLDCVVFQVIANMQAFCFEWNAALRLTARALSRLTETQGEGSNARAARANAPGPC
jgi:hypothetical protein